MLTFRHSYQDQQHPRKKDLHSQETHKTRTTSPNTNKSQWSDGLTTILTAASRKANSIRQSLPPFSNINNKSPMCSSSTLCIS